MATRMTFFDFLFFYKIATKKKNNAKVWVPIHYPAFFICIDVSDPEIEIIFCHFSQTCSQGFMPVI